MIKKKKKFLIERLLLSLKTSIGFGRIIWIFSNRAEYPWFYQNRKKKKKKKNLLWLETGLSLLLVFREANACADMLAHMGVNHTAALRIFQEPPPGLDPLLLADVMGVNKRKKDTNF